MIPVSDVIPCRTRPLATLAILGLTAAAFAWRLTLDVDGAMALAGELGVVPAEFSAASAFSGVTALLVHTGWWHLGTILLPLWLFGRAVEDRLGPWRFLTLYLAGGLAAAWTVSWAAPALTTPVVGAGGAVAAVVAAYLSLFPYSRVIVLVPSWSGIDATEIPAAAVMLFWVIFAAGSGLGTNAPGPAPVLTFWFVMGGFATGLVGGRLLRRRDRMRVSWWSPIGRAVSPRSGDARPETPARAR